MIRIRAIAAISLIACTCAWQPFAGAADSDVLEPPAPGALAPERLDDGARQVYDVTVHDAARLEALLIRLKELSKGPKSGPRAPRLSLVLHGPELNFFDLRNYSRYMSIVDLAAQLTAFGVIEVKACRTRMDDLDLTEEDFPGFIEYVPYGPDEVQRLKNEGYEPFVFM
jgi:intracellular sulfur oxidation DsrE/DsrF family protein